MAKQSYVLPTLSITLQGAPSLNKIIENRRIIVRQLAALALTLARVPAFVNSITVSRHVYEMLIQEKEGCSITVQTQFYLICKTAALHIK